MSEIQLVQDCSATVASVLISNDQAVGSLLDGEN